MNSDDVINTDLFHNDSVLNSCVFFESTPLEILNTISTLKSSHSSGNDLISNCLVKKISIYIVDVLSYIINLSFSTGTYPTKLNEAVVIPIYKKGDRKMIANYKPI